MSIYALRFCYTSGTFITNGTYITERRVNFVATFDTFRDGFIAEAEISCIILPFFCNVVQAYMNSFFRKDCMRDLK